ncbi:hypothetical protein B0H63DRAFT_260256 [Podospora didyma]|uniref:SET domain-containing protein n=1 Tax=Podospora didyma TaxID=330526 RepID=A0AAE0N9C2_9PEZI|nr:hypothetical protein B0H63DRAFT_260256 [Podospora didyma]
MKLPQLISLYAAVALAHSGGHYDQPQTCRFSSGDDSTCLAGQSLLLTPQPDILVADYPCGINGTDCNYVPKHKWTHSSPCFKSTESDDKFCVFTDTNFANGRGASFVMSGRRAAYLATNPGFVEPDLTKDTNQDIETSALYRMKEFPGKGMGLEAKKHIRRGDLIMANTVSLMIDYRVFDEITKEDYMQLQVAAVDNLPAPHRAAVLELSTHHATNLSHIEKIDKLTATNAFDIAPDADDEDQDHSFFVVFPEIARMNHDCRPNADYYYDHATLTQYIHALRDIMPGEEITLSYINPAMTRADRMRRLKRIWGFDCACHLCTQAQKSADASDKRIEQIKGLYWEFRNKKQDSRATPQMAELLISLYEQERLGGSMYEGYALAALEYNGVGDPWTATKFARLAIEYGLTTVGDKDADVKDMLQLAEDPWSHWSWMQRTKTRMGWGKKEDDDSD